VQIYERKIDAIMEGQDSVKKTIDGLIKWQLGIMGGMGMVGIVYAVLTSHPQWFTALAGS
jgi:hypothetical protein